LAALAVFQNGIIIYYKQMRISKKHDVLYKIDYKKTLKYSLVVAITSLGFVLICLSFFGVQSLSERTKKTDDTVTSLDFTQGNYNISQSGYGGGYAGYRGLGGPVKLNNTIAFKVKSDKPYYLRGSVMDDYDGFSWVTSDSGTKDTPISQASQADNSKELIIYPQVIATKTFFTPLNTIQVKYKTGNVVEGKESTYTTGLADGNIFSYYSVLFNDSSNLQVTDYVLSSEDKNKYINYLELPENITQKTIKLVDTVIGNSTNNSDKVEKIKEYLEKNYKYSLSVSKTPQGREFVDYFLFTEKKGYCTYFASAMTVMCRSAGVPARYVEGFLMNDTKDSDGLYLVSNDRAHAWTEVLTDPVNNVWVSVDSTPNDSTGLEKNKTDNKATIKVNTNMSLYNISGPLLIFLAIVTIIIAILLYRIKRFLWKKNKVIMSKSTFPTYIFILKRLIVAKDVLPIHLSDSEFVENLNDSEIKNEMRKVVLAYYDEFYGEINENNLDNEKIIKVIEEYVHRKVGTLKYYMSIILFK
jgi:transglutaminase-like putative cysteine protease